jgi:hypothetical protein
MITEYDFVGRTSKVVKILPKPLQLEVSKQMIKAFNPLGACFCH